LGRADRCLARPKAYACSVDQLLRSVCEVMSDRWRRA
jgi:hypothetical protein